METFLAVTAGGCAGASKSQKYQLNFLKFTGQLLTAKIIQPEMSIVPRLGNAALEQKEVA